MAGGKEIIAKTLDEHIEITPGVAGGKARIAGHRITVLDIAIWYDRLGRSPDEISTEYGLSLADVSLFRDVYAALAYYHDHRAEIDEQMRAGQAFAEALRQQIPSKVPG